MKLFLISGFIAASLATPVMAQEYSQYPAPTPDYPFRRSCLTRKYAVIPPYDYLFRIRVYTTPQQQPYYNVPPYAVISPY